MLENSTHPNAEKEQVILSKQEYEDLMNLVKNYADLQEKNLYLQQELNKLKKMIFGTKSERFVPVSPDQLALFDTPAESPAEPQQETITYTRQKSQQEMPAGHGRVPLPESLPRVNIVIEPENIPQGAKKIGEEITEVLEFTPGKLFVKRYIRPKYLLPQDQGITIGLLPTLPIPRGMVGPGLLAHLIISKYADHLPFYRQVQMFKRDGISLPESTINGWFTQGCQWLEPLYEKLKELVQKSCYLMADETPIPVLTKDKPGATHKGYFWDYGSPLERLVMFDYQKGRGREGPTEMLQPFQGMLQTDGYEGYAVFDHREGITLLACMAHARRKFVEAKDNDKARATHMLALMQKLYATEAKAREQSMTHDERKALRQVESVPVLKEMEEWMKKEIMNVLPKSAIGKAIAYTLKLWHRLVRYVDDGRCEIDNNLIENTIRPIALGRKNYLFAGSHEAAQRAAIVYSLLGTCKLNDVNPQLWLTDVFTNLPDTRMSQIHKFLPNNWKPEN